MKVSCVVWCMQVAAQVARPEFAPIRSAVGRIEVLRDNVLHLVRSVSWLLALFVSSSKLIA